MQFLVIAKDGSDEGAVQRRMRTRPTHLAAIQPLVDGGHILIGGAILDDAGDMVGSMLLAEFPARSDVDAWLDADPYVTEGVWRDVEVTPFRTAVGAWLP